MSKNKVTTSVQFEIPRGFLVYDISDETLYCQGCRKSEACPTISLKVDECLCGRKECPAVVSQHTIGNYFKDFIEQHARCVVKHIEKERVVAIREQALQPCRQDYFNAKGGGPHECGKIDGHSGPCGPE